MRNRETLEFLGLWEGLNNPDFKPLEFEGFRTSAGLHSFTMSPTKWINGVNAIGIVSKAGRYGGTYAHSDIALEFASWISAEFKLYIVKDYQRIKRDENSRLSLNWNLNREIAKLNYRIHTDAVKANLIPPELTPEQISYKYASEADMLNVAVFGKTAKEWRDSNPGVKGNIRDQADLNQLLVLANAESYNAVLIDQGMAQSERLILIRQLVIRQIQSLGKIAYGRRRTEKKIGTRNEMHVVEQDDFPVYEGLHDAIISEADWNLAQEKRKVNAFKRTKIHDLDHAHILSGIIQCPCCGKKLYGNIAKAHSKDKKTRYYYYCKNTAGVTGHKCSFRTNLEQTEINRQVAAIISAMVNKPKFRDAIKTKIGAAVDTDDLEKQMEVFKGQLRQINGTKNRLANQMDTLDVSDPHYDKKISDLQQRYDEQYDKADEIEIQIDDINSRINQIRNEKITGDNIFQLLLAFDQLYDSFTEAEKKEFMQAFIERIDIYPEKPENGIWIRNIVFAFPVPVNGKEIKEYPLEKLSTVESCCLLIRR